MSTLKEQQFVNIFKNGLKIIPRTLSIKTLLSERNLKRIDYKPYYQRNYVWDNEKQTFFIESVLLGTEIPPLILYKSGAKTEVVDGRQRFETLKRFKENEFPLSSKGLMDLPALNRKTFNKLDDELKEIFLNSNIRVFEFEIVKTGNGREWSRDGAGWGRRRCQHDDTTGGPLFPVPGAVRGMWCCRWRNARAGPGRSGSWHGAGRFLHAGQQYLLLSVVHVDEFTGMSRDPFD